MQRGLLCQLSTVETGFVAILVMEAGGVRPGLRT